MLDIAITRPALLTKGALVLLVAQGRTDGPIATPTGLWHSADETTRGAISRALIAAVLTGNAGKTATILAPAPACPALWWLVSARTTRRNPWRRPVALRRRC